MERSIPEIIRPDRADKCVSEFSNRIVAGDKEADDDEEGEQVHLDFKDLRHRDKVLNRPNRENDNRKEVKEPVYKPTEKPILPKQSSPNLE